MSGPVQRICVLILALTAFIVMPVLAIVGAR